MIIRRGGSQHQQPATVSGNFMKMLNLIFIYLFFLSHTFGPKKRPFQNTILVHRTSCWSNGLTCDFDVIEINKLIKCNNEEEIHKIFHSKENKRKVIVAIAVENTTARDFFILSNREKRIINGLKRNQKDKLNTETIGFILSDTNSMVRREIIYQLKL